MFGYFITFAFTLSNIYFFADLIGALVMMYVCVKLAEYNLYYKSALWAVFVFFASCGVRAAAMFPFFSLAPTVGTIVRAVTLASACLTHILMFLGARGISLGAEDNKLAAKCERQLAMSVIYYVVAAVMLIVGEKLGEFGAYLNIVVLVYWFVTFILNLVVIYTCFGKLYPAEEDFTAPKRSRFKFINKLSDKFDEFDEKSNAFRRDSIRMANEEADRRVREKQNNPKKKKKKKK